MRGFEQPRDVDPRGGGGHQPERREHRIAPADVRLPQEDATETVGFRGLLQRRAGVGDCDEMAAGLVLADRLDNSREEIIFQHVWLGRGAGLAGHDEQRSRHVDRCCGRPDLCRIGRIEDPQRGPAGLLAECQRQHFRPKARSAHAEQEHIREGRALHVLRKRLVIGNLLEAQIDAVEPAQPLVLVGARPYDLSRRHKRRTTPRARQSSMASFMGVSSSWPGFNVCVSRLLP